MADIIPIGFGCLTCCFFVELFEYDMHVHDAFICFPHPGWKPCDLGVDKIPELAKVTGFLRAIQRNNDLIQFMSTSTAHHLGSAIWGFNFF